MTRWGGVPGKGRSSGKLLQVLEVDRRIELRSSNGSSPGCGDVRDLLSERTPESSLTEHDVLPPLLRKSKSVGVMSGKEEPLVSKPGENVLFGRFRLTGAGGGSSLGMICLNL